MTDLISGDYLALLADIKERIRTAQYAALKAVNQELIGLYWDIGRMIVEQQEGETWGKSVVEQLARDLQVEFPGTSGFSASNLWRMRHFYETYASEPKLAPMVREIGWSHNILIMVRMPDEMPSIGIILCKAKDRTIVEYALKESNKPMGVATYRIVSSVPDDLRGELPPPAQVARLLEGIE